ncbi:phage tail protein [Staphylococcus simulans]|uniref:tail tube TT1 domain-containing protein n=1 Tax=Staphylococcus simulans TaxID=1286 RepID=UPI00280A9C31|nr:phage tail protein [Staphylococcus simulans]WMM09759.1 phage tail protein [Staphylococcus simulans]
MALVLTDPQGLSYMAQAPTQEDENANADGMLQVKLIENEQTKEFIDKIGELWTITNVTGENDKREYVVVLVEPERWKDKMTVTLTARLKHFDYLATHRVYEDVTGSRTNLHYFETIFADTPYSFTFLDHADAVEWENAGQGADKLSMFLRGVERYGYEWRYEYRAKRFILGKNLNRRPAYYFSKKLNANNVKIETDATEFYTYVRGFGDFEDDAGYTTAKLTMDYPAGAKSPMIDLFGIREAEPVMDGRISKASTMERYMQDRVDPSLKFSIEFDFVSLMEQYPYAQPEIYDIVPFIDNKLEIQQEMKVVGISTKRDAKHKPISKKLTIGDQQLRNRQRKQQAGLTKEISSILHGGGSLPYDVLPRAVKESSELLQGTRSEIGWSENGLLLTDKTNPNYVTLLNSSGIGVSNDGGQTFEEAIRRGAINANLITAGALNANYIRGGVIDTNLVRIEGTKGYFSIDGDEMLAQDPDSLSQTQITPRGLNITRPDGAVYMQNGMPRMSLEIQKNQMSYHTVEFEGMSYKTSETSYQYFEYFYTEHKARYLTVSYAVGWHADSENNHGYVGFYLQEFGQPNNRQISKRIYASKDTGEVFGNVTIDLGTPTYEPIQFYLKFKNDTDNRNNVATIRSTRIHMRG